MRPVCERAIKGPPPESRNDPKDDPPRKVDEAKRGG